MLSTCILTKRRVLTGLLIFGTILYILCVNFVLKRNVFQKTFKTFDELNEKDENVTTFKAIEKDSTDNVSTFDNNAKLKKNKRPPQTMPPLKNGFQLVFPHIEPKLSPEDQTLYLVVMVTGSAKGEDHRILRKTIRQTWGDTKLLNMDMTKKWKMFFSLAISDNQQDNEANEKEAVEYNDVIIGNFSETYLNLVRKVFMGHYWVINRLSCRYVLKADDDVYVRVPRLISWLVKSGSPKSFYGGYISLANDGYKGIIRDPNSPWYVSYEEYSETYYPRWCRGPFYVISSDNIPKYLDYLHIRNPFKTEDTYTAVISHELGISATFIPGFQIIFSRRKYSSSELNEFMTLGHRLLAIDLKSYYDYYVRNNLTNV